MLNLFFEFKEENSIGSDSVVLMSSNMENYYRNTILYISNNVIGVLLIRELLCHTKCLLMVTTQRKPEL